MPRARSVLTLVPAPAELAGLVVATALSLPRHHAETLIIPMSLIRDAYRAGILGCLADAGEEVLHVFLTPDTGPVAASGSVP